MIRVKTGRAERATVCVLTVFNIISVIYSMVLCNTLYALSSLASLALVFVPYILEAFFRIRLSTDLKIIAMFLVIGGPVLGNVYKLYHRVRFWDKAMHALSGYAIAALGYALADILEPKKGEHSRVLKCVFALGFSLSIGVLWEIYEYALDVLLHLDMQNDTLITDLSSYALGEETGVIGSIRDIDSVVVNGQTLPGYIDIGLIDTMNDLITCALGAACLCVVSALCGKSNFASVTLVS